MRGPNNTTIFDQHAKTTSQAKPVFISSYFLALYQVPLW